MGGRDWHLDQSTSAPATPMTPARHVRVHVGALDWPLGCRGAFLVWEKLEQSRFDRFSHLPVVVGLSTRYLAVTEQQGRSCFHVTRASIGPVGSLREPGKSPQFPILCVFWSVPGCS
jgi:hypothetical protein